MKITLINPNNVTQKGDFFGTGIPYMPIVLAYVASYLKKKGHNIQVIDAFGKKPFKKRCKGEFIILGMDEQEIVNEINKDSDLICIYAGHIVEHNTIIDLIKEAKKRLKIPIAIIENSQNVTSYSLLRVKEEFFNANANFIIYGEPELTILELINELKEKSNRFFKIKGLIYKDKNKIKVNERRKQIANLDNLPFPAWDLFPIENYWKLGYGHAPTNKPYLQIISSRGCPYNCRFCIVPSMNQRIWEARSAKNVFDEMKYSVRKYNIKEFHFEDLNAAIDKKRIEELCKLIIRNKLNIKLKFVSGIKIETIDENTLRLLKKAGCDYISISPESGSKRVLQLMDKPFNYEHGLKMVKAMNKLGITSQACFILGFPGEKKNDIIKTKKYLYKLFRAGLDETAILIMTPSPGSEPYESFQLNHKDLSRLTFSPKWRKNYKYLHKIRTKMYLASFLIKLFFHPLKFFYVFFNSLLGNFKNKIEMTLYRVIKVYFLIKENT